MIAPIVVATVRALLRGWQPIGDNGILAVRAGDVLTSHHPLLGSWTSASVVSGQDVNNPGPLYSDLIAIPVKLLGSSVGLATGVMLVNIAAVVLAVLFAERLGGRVFMLAVTVAVVLLEWSMSSELLFDVWQPNALVLPAMAWMVAGCGVAAGRPWCLPWMLGIASVLVQTHLSYVYLVVFATLGAALLGVAAARRQGFDVWRRPLGVTAVVLVVAWAQPVIEQLTSSGRGNISALLSASRQDSARIGVRLAARLTADVLVVPPAWGRPSYDSAVPLGRIEGVTPLALTSLAVAGAALALLVGMLALAWWWNRRCARPELAASAAFAAALVAGCVVSVALLPLNTFGLTPHQIRWLWPVAAMAFALLLASLCAVLIDVRPDGGRLTLAALCTVAAAGAVAALPTAAMRTGPTADRDVLPAAEELASQLDPLDGRGTVLFDVSTLQFADPYSGVVFSELEDRDIPFVFEDAGLIRQFGERRRDDGEAQLRIWLRTGPEAIADDELTPGVERVASVRGLNDAEVAELDELDVTVRAIADERGLRLSSEGQDAARLGRLPASALNPEPGQSPFDAIGSVRLAVSEGWLDLDDDVDGDFERWADLANRLARHTVALYAGPVNQPPDA